jgi:hypothetical protein
MHRDSPHQAATSPPMTREQIRSVVTALGYILAVLADAEPSPAGYIDTLRAVFHEARRPVRAPTRSATRAPQTFAR